MAESQEDIDALLAEVNALADEAVADIAGDEASADSGASSPDGMLDPAVSDSSASQPAHSTEPAPPRTVYRGGGLDRVLNIVVPVIVRLAERTMPLSNIINLSTGSIIEFEKLFDSELDLMINNKCIARGLAVKVGENFGLRVKDIGTVRERIQAMGDH